MRPNGQETQLPVRVSIGMFCPLPPNVYFETKKNSCQDSLHESIPFLKHAKEALVGILFLSCSAKKETDL